MYWYMLKQIILHFSLSLNWTELMGIVILVWDVDEIVLAHNAASWLITSCILSSAWKIHDVCTYVENLADLLSSCKVY